MNTMVAARIPVEVKNQGDSILKSLGSNPTDLINRAYAYVLEYHALPGQIHEATDDNPVVRQVLPTMLDSIRAAYEGMSLPLEDAWGQKDYKEIRDDFEDDRYARFA